MKNADSKRRFYIYQQKNKQYVEVPEHVFREFYRYTKRERYVLQKEGKCSCPKSYIVRCDCDCDVCPYRMKSALTGSVTKNHEGFDGNITDYDLPDAISIEDELNYRRLREVVELLAKIYPDSRRIILLRYQGLNDCEIERIVGIGRRTFQYRLKRALQKLGFDVDDFR